MHRSRRVPAVLSIILACLIAIIAAPWLLAADNSVTPINKGLTGITIPAQPVTRWVVQANASGADGTALGDVYAWSGWAAAAREATDYAAAQASPYVGGRLLLCQQSQSRYEVCCLFDAAGGTATIQFFTFDYVDKANVPDASEGSLVYPSSLRAFALGMPYNRARDSAAQTITVSATAEIFKAGYSTTGAAMYADQSAGTTYYVSTRIIFDSAGGHAELPYITAIGGGATKCIVLGRPI